MTAEPVCSYNWMAEQKDLKYIKHSFKQLRRSSRLLAGIESYTSSFKKQMGKEGKLQFMNSLQLESADRSAEEYQKRPKMQASPTFSTVKKVRPGAMSPGPNKDQPGQVLCSYDSQESMYRCGGLRTTEY